MGADDEDDIDAEEAGGTDPDLEGTHLAITGAVSSIHVLCPKIKPQAICLKGQINGCSVSLLIDTGSTHNFIKPAIAEKLSLPLHSIAPFRVFVGDGAALKCTLACLATPIMIQGHLFEIDLFILPVKGPDVILGVQWLQDLGDITQNFHHLTMRFN